jgi:hypothetical protein
MMCTILINDNLIVSGGDEITIDIARKIEEAGIETLRSVLY